MTIQLAFARYTARLRDFIQTRAAAASHDLAPEPDEACFHDLARELFELQLEHNAAYRRFCDTRQMTPDRLKHWSEIPALPTLAFKEWTLTSPVPKECATVFHSSGTSERAPSRHFHSAESLAVYETSLLAGFRNCFGTAAEAQPHTSPPAMVCLTPSPALARHSSLVHMLDTLRRAWSAPPASFSGAVDATGAWTVDTPRARAALEQLCAERRPAMLLGTAFNFVHLLDSLTETDRRLRLPVGSWVMETGGYKGRSRSLPQSELHALITDRLGVPGHQIVCEYGMCELSSQAYDHRLASARPGAEPVRRFQFPPWARAKVISPENGDEVAEGETGLLRVFDLANVASVLAVQTEDLGIRRGRGFELLGRATTAEPRGCSLLAV